MRARASNRTFAIGKNYAYMELTANAPDDVMVQLNVGSACRVTGFRLSIDQFRRFEARRIRGRVTAKVGSGDIELDDIGSLNVLSIGSGDVVARNVRGNAEVGSIGSGDFTATGVGGNVDIGSIGSGDADVERVTGNVVVGSIGSGSLDAERVTGNLTVRSKGSGDIDHSGVAGTVESAAADAARDAKANTRTR